MSEPRMVSGEESAEILAEHVSYTTDPECIGCGESWPCLPYHLAYTVQEQAEQIAAVLALHVSDESPYGAECNGCRSECFYCEGDHPYPCPTARIFLKANEYQTQWRNDHLEQARARDRKRWPERKTARALGVES